MDLTFFSSGCTVRGYDILICWFCKKEAIFMGKFRDLKKKLLAGLCAFASGVGGASALDNTSIDNPDLLILSNLINDSKRSIVNLDLDKEGMDLLDLFGSVIAWGNGSKLRGFSQNEDLKNKNRDFALGMRANTPWFEFIIFSEVYGGAAETNKAAAMPSILEIKVELNYIVKRLRQKGYKFDKANSKVWKGANDLGVPPENLEGLNETIKADLADIITFDVMGSNIHIDSSSVENANGSWINFIKNYLAPKIDGLQNWTAEGTAQVDAEPANNQLMTRFSNTNSAGCDNEGLDVPVYQNFKADRKSIFKKFFTNSSEFKNSDYYKTIKRAPYTSGMSVGHKVAVAFDGILGFGTLGGGMATYLMWLKNQRDKASSEEEREKLEKEIKILKAQASKFEKAKKMAQAKRSQSALSILNAVEKGNGGNNVKKNLRNRGGRRS